MTEEEIQAIKEKDMQEYSRKWDSVKRFVLESGDAWYEHDCGGLMYGDNERFSFEYINTFKKAFEESNHFKAFLLLEALSELTDIANQHTGQDFSWIYEAFYERTKQTSQTEWEHLVRVLFIKELMEGGATQNACIDACADWKNVAKSTCEKPYYEFRILNRKFKNFLEFDYPLWHLIPFLKNARKPFFSKNKLVMNGYNLILEKIEKDKISKMVAEQLALDEMAKALDNRKK